MQKCMDFEKILIQKWAKTYSHLFAQACKEEISLKELTVGPIPAFQRWWARQGFKAKVLRAKQSKLSTSMDGLLHFTFYHAQFFLKKVPVLFIHFLKKDLLI